MKRNYIVSFLFCFLSSISCISGQQAESLSYEAQLLASSGLSVQTAGAFPFFQFPLGQHNVWTDVSKQKYNGEDALLFFVIKMPNGFGRLYITKSLLAYEPEGGANINAFTIDRSSIRSIEYQQNWQAFQNVPNINVIYQKDKKQFGINRVRPSSDYAQIDIEKYRKALNYLYQSLTDFDRALRIFDELVAEKERLTNLEEESKKAAIARAEAEEREKEIKRQEELSQARTRLDARLKLAEKYAQDRMVYDQEVQVAISKRAPQLRGMSPAVKSKVEAAIKALRKMSAAAEVGVIFTEYSSRLIDTKAAVDEAAELLPENLLNRELQLAVDAYVDAAQAWNKANKDEILTGHDELFWPLVNKYSLVPDTSDPERPRLTKQQLLSSIWQAGSIHVRNSASLASF